MIHISYH